MCIYLGFDITKVYNDIYLNKLTYTAEVWNISLRIFCKQANLYNAKAYPPSYE